MKFEAYKMAITLPGQKQFFWLCYTYQPSRYYYAEDISCSMKTNLIKHNAGVP